MKNKLISAAYILLVLIGVGGIAFSGLVLSDWWRWIHITESRKDILMRMRADLSQPGVYHAEYRQRVVPWIGSVLVIVPDDPSWLDREDYWISGLEYEVIVYDQSGHVVYTSGYGQHLTEDHRGEIIGWSTPDGHKTFALYMRDSNFPPGNYLCEVIVHKGVNALRGVPHQLVARYELSVLPMAQTFQLFVAILIFIVSLILLALGIVKYRKLLKKLGKRNPK